MQQVVSEVDDHVPVLGQRLDCLLGNVSGLLIVALEAQIPFLFAKYLRFLQHVFAGSVLPRRRQSHIVRLDCGVHASRNNQRIVGSQRIPLVI